VSRGSVAAIAAASVAAGLLAATMVPATAAGAPAIGRQSRTSDVAVAGADVYMWSTHRSINSGDACTLSFAVRTKRSHRIGALTAGHCVTTIAGGPTYTVHETRAGRGNTTDPGLRLGDVHYGAYRLGRNGDSAFVRVGSHRRARPWIFTGGATTHHTIPVAGIAHLHDGLRVCYSGAVSGEHCGFKIVGRPATVTFRDGARTLRIAHEWRATRGTCTSRLGDSGAPVYVRKGGKAYAVGILSGGQERASKCPFYFTSVVLALSRLKLTLLTAS
jgi:Trypsin